MNKLYLSIISIGLIMLTNFIKTEPNFYVIGITIRTTNKAAAETGSIAKLWQQFFSENISAQIPSKIDDAIIALYYEYENDKNGEYSLLIGNRVSSIDIVPAGMVAQHVKAEKRVVFNTESGPINTVVMDLWAKIWNLEDQGELVRNYIADYELYDEQSMDPQNAVVEAHIGIK